jgi:uncharacterized protein YndB with AHSA1/START domain
MKRKTLPRVAYIENIIAAPIGVIWEIMVDLKGYQKWNPFITNVLDCDRITAPGQRFRLDVKWSNGTGFISPERVTVVQPPNGGFARLAYAFSSWASTIYMVRAERVQTLQALDDKNIRYTTEETFTGWGTRWLPLADVEDGFKRQAAALEVYAETRYRANASEGFTQK